MPFPSTVRPASATRLAAVATLFSLAATATAEVTTLHDAFQQGSVSGHLRAYDNDKNPHGSDRYNTFAGGLSLHGETAPLNGFSGGATFYGSNDFGWQNDAPGKHNINLPPDAAVVGEAWLQYQAADTLLRVGRQKVNTPFAGPADGFLIPFTFEALRLTNTHIDNLTLSAYYLKRIKDRPVEAFEDGAQFALDRYGVAGDSDRGTWAAGAEYKAGGAIWQGWMYGFTDLFNIYYAQVDYRFKDTPLTPGLGLQIVHAADSGDALLGDVNARGMGLKASLGGAPLSLALAWNRFLEDRDSFKDGALPTPFTTSNAPTYTNSMTQTLDNSAAGNAYKLILRSEWSSQWSAQASYARYQRLNAVDTDETDLDISYRFAGAYKGLSLRFRLGLIGSDDDANARFTEARTQLQYVF